MELTTKDPLELVPDKTEQKENINSMYQLTTRGLISSLMARCSFNKYYVIKYDVQTNLNECKNFATFFSNNAEMFLGKSRREIQFDDLSLTMTIDQWVSCNQLPNGIFIGVPIEYYICTRDFFPYVIFFRISKDIKEHKKIMNIFINTILGREVFNTPVIHQIEMENYNTIEMKTFNSYSDIFFRQVMNSKNGKSSIILNCVKCGLLLLMIGIFIATISMQEYTNKIYDKYDNQTYWIEEN